MDDRTYIGNPIPKYTYGFAFDAEYKILIFQPMFQGFQGWIFTVPIIHGTFWECG
jgi:hypothetical protein